MHDVTLIRNMDKLIWKLKQKTFRSASQLTVFASASGTLAHQEETGVILAQALLAWWKDPYYVARRAGDGEVERFVRDNVRRRHTNNTQQEVRWNSGGNLITFRFKEGVGSNELEQAQAAVQLADMRARQQQEEVMYLQQQNEELQHAISEISYQEWLQNKRPREGQEKGYFRGSASDAIESGTEVLVHMRGGKDAVLRVLKDILEACTRKPVNTSGPT